MIRGTSHDQDARFKDKAHKMLLQSKWPDKYDIKIDLNKVDLQIMRTWIQKRTTELLGYQDDIVSGTVLSLLEQSLKNQQKPNAKKIHIGLSGFLSNHTLTFVSQLWDLLDEAQKSKSGIPKQLFDSKKNQQQQRKQKMKDLNNKKQKIKNYKFNVIERHVGKQRQSSVQDRRRQRQKQKRDCSNQRSSKKNKKNRQRSYSREKKKRRRGSEQRSQQRYQYDDRTEKKQENKKKKKNKRAYSSSSSKSRSREKQKRGIKNQEHNKHSDSNQRVQLKKYKQKNIKKRDKSPSAQSRNQKDDKEIPQKSESSEVVSSSQSES